MSGDLFWLSDAQFAKIEPLLPTKTRGVKRVDDRRVIEALDYLEAQSCCRVAIIRRLRTALAEPEAASRPAAGKAYTATCKAVAGKR